MSTNEERRAEARQRLREQMEAQARREKQLKFIGAAVVAVLVLGLVGFVVWNKVKEKQAAEYAANWMSCDYPIDPPKEKADPKAAEGQGPDAAKQVAEYNKAIDTIKEKIQPQDPPSGDLAKKGTANITLDTNYGPIPVALDRSKAPCNVASFVNLTEKKYFDGSPCHRLSVSKDEQGLSMLQCGDPSGTGMGGPGYSVKDEAPQGLAAGPDPQVSVYPRGTIAMAKSQAPDSAGSQFFLVYKDSLLPPQYTVMGTIGEAGLKVLDEIAKVGTKSDTPDPNQASGTPDNETPKKPITLTKAVLDSEQDVPSK